MDKLIKKCLPFFLALMILGGLSAVPHSAHAATLIMNDHDLDGIPGNEVLWDNGNGKIQAVYFQSDFFYYYYPEWYVPNRVYLTARNVDDWAGDEIIILDSSHNLHIINTPMNNSNGRMLTYNLSAYSSYGTPSFQFADLDGVAGDEIIIQFSASPKVLVLSGRSINSYEFQAIGNRSVFTYVDSDGTAGKEILIVSTSGYAKTLSFVKKQETQYNVPAGWSSYSFIESNNLPGSEIIFYYPTRRINITDLYQFQSYMTDNTDAAVTYSGTWNVQTDCNRYYNCSVNWTTTAGSYVQYTFKGTSVIVYASKNNLQGKIDVYIDGVLQATGIDMYSPTASDNVAVFTKTGLSNANHTIKVVERSDHNPASGNYFFALDYFAYY